MFNKSKKNDYEDEKMVNDVMQEEEFSEEQEKNEEQENDSTEGELILLTAIDVDGEKVKKISYDFENVKPIEYINLVKRTEKKKGNVSIPELDMDIQIGLFALAARMPVSVIKSVKTVRDLTKICHMSRDFLLNGSDVPEELDLD